MYRDYGEMWYQKKRPVILCVMHGVLALSALHIIHRRPNESERHMRLCDNHQAKAVGAFHSLLSTQLNEQLSQPMFALASVISISSVARSCAVAYALPEPRYVSMDQVTELFLLTRGVGTIVDACVSWLRSSPLAPVLAGYDIPDRDQVTLPDVVTERFRVLDEMIETACFGEHQRNICRDALSALEDVHRSVVHYSAKNQLQTGHVFSWMTAIPLDFVTFIRASVPPALVILAHFASVSLAVQSAWYSTNWGNYCLQGIKQELHGHDLQHWLDWPKAHADTNMSILTAESNQSSS
ncbi:hypothetical protein CB0940_02079 [Cercospora beticola]|uniref:Sterol uptake control protein 2 n=1 Tax=Cercospora beticola TaxID=122368 RepID=A0A2G5IAU5_CERBT|nr:hypothetical protein CB0940_02079 [Cercospora beticola]PIB01593.1 hypothetical protein CB0940_02079 [Cercospora beticola]